MSRTYGHSSDSHFTEIASANIKRSSFNRSHGSKLTCYAGFIVPIFVDEVLPGDTFKRRTLNISRRNLSEMRIRRMTVSSRHN